MKFIGAQFQTNRASNDRVSSIFYTKADMRVNFTVYGYALQLYTKYPIVARALGLAVASASREQRYLAYNYKHYKF